MTTDKLALNSQDSLSSASSSSSSNTLVLRLREGDASHGFDMQFSDIIDVDIRNKVTTLLPFYPSYPLLYLVYVLIRSNRTLIEAQDFLENTHRDQAQYLPITSMTDLEDIKDARVRDKVEKIRTVIPCVTVWWAYYALKVCDKSTDCATILLLENIVDASKDPVTQVALVSTSPVSSSMSPRSSGNVLVGPLVDSQSDSDSHMFHCTTPSPNSGNESFQTKPSSLEALSRTPNRSFVNISEDEEDSTTEETATFSASPDSNRRGVSMDKGKGVDRSDPADYNSDIDMNGVPPSEEKSQAKKRHEKQNSNCKFCGKELGNWLVRAGHENLCRMRTRQVCVECKEEVSKSNIRRHEGRCDGRRTLRRDGLEFKERDVHTRPSVSRGSSTDFESENSPTEEQLQKAKRMREFLPHLSVDQCIESLGLCDDNVEDAIDLEMEASASGEEDDDRGSCSQKVIPTKRKLGNLLEERVTKKSRTQVNDREASLEPASQWIKTTFLGLCQDSTNITHVHLAGSESRQVPTKLICDNAKTLQDMISLGDQKLALQEISLLDVEPTLFDAMIQYMVCRNASLGSHLGQTQKITSIVNFLVLANKLKVVGPAITMFQTLEAILKEERKGPYPPSVLKVDHVNKVFLTFEAGHPIRKLFVRASVRPFLKTKNEDIADEEDSDNNSEVEVGNIENDGNKPAHLAWKVNSDFAIALLAKVHETTSNRETRPTNKNSRYTKNLSEFFKDPLDGSWFTL
ncbi:hypothetical protein EAF04_000049 [Stromatinia cepivora]|nr:hypothetical protein EAF04_000049 [Stromatinia cepivora]